MPTPFAPVRLDGMVLTGTVMERSGMMGLDVTDVKAADAVAK